MRYHITRYVHIRITIKTTPPARKTNLNLHFTFSHMLIGYSKYSDRIKKRILSILWEYSFWDPLHPKIVFGKCLYVLSYPWLAPKLQRTKPSVLSKTIILWTNSHHSFRVIIYRPMHKKLFS